MTFLRDIKAVGERVGPDSSFPGSPFPGSPCPEWPSGPVRLEMEISGQIVFANCRREGDRLVVDHVEAPPALRGTGAAGRFMAALAAQAREAGLRIVPLCGYAAAWLRRHPEHHDLMA